jgi:hypothetical protein
LQNARNARRLKLHFAAAATASLSFFRRDFAASQALFDNHAQQSADGPPLAQTVRVKLTINQRNKL